MNSGIQYTFEAELWQHAAPGGWCFVSLPSEMSQEIRQLLKSKEEGWGRLKTTTKIGTSTWKTAIWFDTKLGTYLLPVKADIRSTEGLYIDKIYYVTIWI
jgi:hypothetical protein